MARQGLDPDRKGSGDHKKPAKRKREKGSSFHKAELEKGFQKRHGPLPLQGLLVAVSTLTESSNGPTESYSTLRSTCERAGIIITAQVHKRVKCVVATESAVTGQTQRVRKAWKKGIPVVSTDWLQLSIEKGVGLEFGDFLWQQPDHFDAKGALCAQKEGQDGEKEEVSREINLGCCCVCHENGDINCSWCVECKGPT